MSKRRAGSERRFPKPQVRGSSPLGVTSEPKGPSRLKTARAALLRSLTDQGHSRKTALAVLKRIDHIALHVKAVKTELAAAVAQAVAR